MVESSRKGQDSSETEASEDSHFQILPPFLPHFPIPPPSLVFGKFQQFGDLGEGFQLDCFLQTHPTSPLSPQDTHSFWGPPSQDRGLGALPLRRKCWEGAQGAGRRELVDETGGCWALDTEVGGAPLLGRSQELLWDARLREVSGH